MPPVSATQEKTTLQSVAMILISLGTVFVSTHETLENKVFGCFFFLTGIAIMLYKYEREKVRGVPQ